MLNEWIGKLFEFTMWLALRFWKSTFTSLPTFDVKKTRNQHCDQGIFDYQSDLFVVGHLPVVDVFIVHGKCRTAESLSVHGKCCRHQHCKCCKSLHITSECPKVKNCHWDDKTIFHASTANWIGALTIFRSGIWLNCRRKRNPSFKISWCWWAFQAALQSYCAFGRRGTRNTKRDDESS